MMRHVRDVLLRGVRLTVFFTGTIWMLVFAVSVYQYHYSGVVLDHVIWAPHRLTWTETLPKAAYAAGVGAAIMLMLGAAIAVTMGVATAMLMGMASLIRGRRAATGGQHERVR